MSGPVLELTSDPENINNKQCKFEDQIYTIKNYDRNMVSDAFNELFAYKSVIYDEFDNQYGLSHIHLNKSLLKLST